MEDKRKAKEESLGIIAWEEPRPSGRGQGWKEWEKRLLYIRKVRPGEWAKFGPFTGTHVKKRADRAAERLHERGEVTDGTFESTTRSFDETNRINLHVRFVPEEEE